MSQEPEQVWGIPRQDMVDLIGDFQGFLADSSDILSSCLRLENQGSFRDRPAAEEDPTWKQVIPYVCIDFEGQILVLQRLATQGEKRLHGKKSIGVGGHVNPEKEGSLPLLLKGLRRELEEEIGLIPEPEDCEVLGWINDDQTSVGQVHLGWAVRVKAKNKPRIVETDRMTGEWVSLKDLHPDDENWESWSSLLIRHLKAVISA
ncbi:MAG: NUDIX domain-containing protein [Planctomycetia bacterium]|nr:NUDIX domain-containing protein [Planctomycetia bacterium]NCG00075.1 NUDIX domain-containing protein [Planctomycetia bacterium]NCG11945.1 NUDIX domain-containing protein [Planctomycetia bacterium]NCG57451.1 NUDIX domain-containing protein [Pseudomonadota bacterium]